MGVGGKGVLGRKTSGKRESKWERIEIAVACITSLSHERTRCICNIIVELSKRKKETAGGPFSSCGATTCSLGVDRVLRLCFPHIFR
jgi:hypothetical protein